MLRICSYPSPVSTLTLPGQQEDHSRCGRLFHCVRRQMVLVLDSGQTHAQEQAGISVIKQRSKKRSREMVPASWGFLPSVRPGGKAQDIDP